MSPKTTIPKVSKTPELLLNIANFRCWLIGYARLGKYWSESLVVLSPEGWNTLCRGRRPRQQCKRGAFIGAVPGTGHARGLRPCGSRDRLRRLMDQGARWF
jgi:hypothetical protein